jgi:hypothetical protein
VQPRGLPTGIDLRDLRSLPCDAIPPASDSVPQMENEFFDSRQVGLIWEAAVLAKGWTAGGDVGLQPRMSFAAYSSQSSEILGTATS